MEPVGEQNRRRDKAEKRRGDPLDQPNRVPVPQLLRHAHEDCTSAHDGGRRGDDGPDRVPAEPFCRQRHRQGQAHRIKHPVGGKLPHLKAKLLADRGIKDAGTVVEKPEAPALKRAAASQDEPCVMNRISFFCFHADFLPDFTLPAGSRFLHVHRWRQGAFPCFPREWKCSRRCTGRRP